MSIDGYSYQNKPNSLLPGVACGTLGMCAYFLPVTKDRFVRTTFSLKKELNEDKFEKLCDVAKKIDKKKVSVEDKIFLKELGVDETIDSITQKCIDLRNEVLDKDKVKDFKKFYEDNFLSFKKSESSMDNIASHAFKRIKWTNFGWGIGIGFILGSAIGASMNK